MPLTFSGKVARSLQRAAGVHWPHLIFQTHLVSLDLLKLRKFKMEEQAWENQCTFYYKQLEFNVNYNDISDYIWRKPCHLHV